MKNFLYKTRYLWTVLLAIVMGLILLWLTGCAVLHGHIPDCKDIARETAIDRHARGLDSVIVYGTRNGIGHAWVEDPYSHEIIDNAMPVKTGVYHQWKRVGFYFQDRILEIPYNYKVVAIKGE